jgi:uncharacterized membrane-anchored protein YhcB (DUF1043 family)
MLESVTLDPFVAAAAALLGVLVGLLMGRFVFPGRREIKRLRAEIERLGREHVEYQGRVAGHFRKTGELIGQMTQSYKAVYDHLADGAQTLCTEDALPKPAFTTPRLIVDESVTIGAAPLHAPAHVEGAHAPAASVALPQVNEAADVVPGVAPVEGLESKP